MLKSNALIVKESRENDIKATEIPFKSGLYVLTRQFNAAGEEATLTKMVDGVNVAAGDPILITGPYTKQESYPHLKQ